MEQTEITVQPRSLKTARRVGACLLTVVAVMLPIAFTTQNDVLQVVLAAISILAGGFGLICLFGQDGKPDWETIERHRGVRQDWDDHTRRTRDDMDPFRPGSTAWYTYGPGRRS